MQELFRNESVGRVLVSDYTTKAEFVIPDMNKILGYEKYRIVNEDIKEGLQNIIVGSEKYSNTAVKAEIFLERLKESRQGFINDFLQPEIKQVCKNMGFKNYPTARFKEVDTKDSTQTQRVATRLMELGLITPEQGMDVINKGVFPEAEEIGKSQNKFVEDRKKGYYNPIVGGVPMVEMEEEEDAEVQVQKVPGLPGRPNGTKDIPQETARANVSAEEISKVIKASEDLRDFCKKIARKHFKIKRLNNSQNEMIDNLCEKVIIAKDLKDWKTTAESCVKNNKNILKLDLSKEVEKTADNHKLTNYSAAIVYHSKNFSNQ
tara:strand:- start:617 stop:1573 length:957 start_codon:yes stop_codon:yes gene_type:complete